MSQGFAGGRAHGASTQPADRNRFLEGKTAVVTGAGSGLGRAIAKLFSSASASVVVLSLKADEVDRVAEEIRADGGKAVGLVADVADLATGESMTRTALEAFGGLHVLVNNAAYFERADALTLSPSAWTRMTEVACGAALRLSQAAAREMIRQRSGGRIVNVTSIEARYVDPGACHYGSAKAALEQLTRCLAVELAPHDILVNAVAPGFMDTPMSILEGVNELEDETFRSWYVGRRKIPLARAARPEEVAEAVLYLASPLNTYVTGHSLVVDGGLTCTF